MESGSHRLTLDDVAALLDQPATADEHCHRFAAPILNKMRATLVAVIRGPRSALRLAYAGDPFGPAAPLGSHVADSQELDRVFAGEILTLKSGRPWPEGWPLADLVPPGRGAAVLIPLAGNDEVAGFALIAGVPHDLSEQDVRALRAAARVLALALVKAPLRDEYERLSKASNIDATTGLFNRSAFYERLRVEFRRASRDVTPLALALLDIDYYIAYNDEYGEAEADRALYAVAQTVAGAGLRSSDFVSRYGGAALALVLPGSEAEGAISLCDRIRHAIADRSIRHSRSPFGVVTASVGVASMRPNARRVPASLIYEAESALYRAKQAGRNRVASKDEIRTSPAASRRSLLPAPPAVPFDREEELSRLLAIDAPLLTIVGPPNSGKSRLALELARRATERAVYVDLAGAGDGAVVAKAGEALHATPSSVAQLVAALRDRAEHEAVLIVLDHGDEARNGVAELVQSIHGIASLRTIVTAAQALGLRGEHAYVLESLP